MPSDNSLEGGMGNMIRDLITARERSLEAQLRRMSQELDLPFLQAFYEVALIGPDGKVLDGVRSRSHSWTRNGYNLAFSTIAQKNASDASWEAGKLSARNTVGTVHSGSLGFRSHDTNLDDGSRGFRGMAGVVNQGIVVGSGDQSESLENYRLDTLIANGTGYDQLSYADQDPHVITYATSILKDTLIRCFNNNSGAAVDVVEIGLYGQLGNPASTGYATYMVARDVLGAPISLPDTGQLRVTYEISLTYP